MGGEVMDLLNGSWTRRECIFLLRRIGMRGKLEFLTSL